jgi:hypothetical protein
MKERLKEFSEEFILVFSAVFALSPKTNHFSTMLVIHELHSETVHR